MANLRNCPRQAAVGGKPTGRELVLNLRVCVWDEMGPAGTSGAGMIIETHPSEKINDAENSFDADAYPETQVFREPVDPTLVLAFASACHYHGKASDGRKCVTNPVFNGFQAKVNFEENHNCSVISSVGVNPKKAYSKE